MTTEAALTDSALRSWKQNLDRADKFFSGLSEEQLQKEVAPGKNRLIYLWGHLAAVNDGMLPLPGFGKRLHPELDALFLSNPDRSQATIPSGAELKKVWGEINEVLSKGLAGLIPSGWMEKHSVVSQEDFLKEPHRNRFSILLSRTAHIGFHMGQAVLTNTKE